jgi:L-threonylcarbamoyladenylate synthase
LNRPARSVKTNRVIIDWSIESYPRIASIIAGGGIIAFGTDTFYGLGADPFNRKAVQRIKQLKGRDDKKPILIVISDDDQITRFIAEPSRAFRRLSRTFWPGALTLIGKATPGVADEITAGTNTVGVRLPGDEDVRALVRACGGALTATSANPRDQDPAKTAEEVSSYFKAGLDLIVDAGSARIGQPSTVVDVCDDEPRLIREGVISWRAIQAAMEPAGSRRT